MRRLTLILSAALLVLAVAPSAALAQHHRRHHSRIERFGDVRVKSFSGGVLTIMLRNGSTVRSRVNKNTRLECMAPEHAQVIHDGRDGGSGDDQAQSSGDGSAGGGPGDVADQNENQIEEQNENQAEEQNENQAEEQNENEAAEENENEAEHCSTANLAPGRVVREAELRVFSGGKKVWQKVELLS